MIKRWYAALMLVCYFAAGVALHSEAGIRFDHLTPEHGLSESFVSCMLQDKKGFMWFGTLGGLNKYDGSSFTAYIWEPGSPGSIGHPNISSIAEDQSGILWVGTLGGGLNRFDPTTGSSSSYRHQPDNTNSLSSNRISHICISGTGALWIGTFDGGLNRFDPATETVTRYRYQKDDNSRISSDMVFYILEESGGVIWIATGRGLNRFDPGTGVFKSYVHDPRDPGSLSHNAVRTLYRDSTGVLWVGTNGGGLNRFEPRTGTFTHYRHRPGSADSLGDDVVNAICEDHQGMLWIGTGGSGVSIMEPGNETFFSLRHDPGKIHSIGNNNIRAIYRDRQGITWLGTPGGIDKFVPARQKFEWFNRDPGSPAGLSSDFVTSVGKDSQGRLWIGTMQKGLNIYDRHSERAEVYRRNPDDDTSLSSDSIWSIVRDRGGTSWIGTSNGLCKAVPSASGFRFTRYLHGPGIRAELGQSVTGKVAVGCIAEGQEGVLWLGTFGLGLLKMDTSNNRFSRYTAANGSGLSDNFVYTVIIDNDGNPWVGTSRGADRYDSETGKFKPVNLGEAMADPVVPVSVNIIFRDSLGNTWVGTASAGLIRIDRVTREPHRYTTRDGLPNNSVTGILEDKNGNLWIGSRKGISRFNPGSGIFRNFGAGSGLQGYNFNVGACFHGEDGEMLFGGVNGLNAFYPARMQENTHIPPVVFTRFTIFNQPVPVGGDSPLQKDISETREIVVSHRQNVFSFSFAALDYSYPTDNRYKYKLEGVHQHWIELGNRNEVSFTNQEPGEYTLRVIGSNDEGRWNETGASIKIIITPPFWKTLWFRLLMLVAMLVLLYFWHLRRMRALSLRLKTETQLENLFERYHLSPREKEIAHLIIKGKTNKEIEDLLYISLTTVKSHVSNIYKKVGVKTRLEMINLVQRKTKI